MTASAAVVVSLVGVGVGVAFLVCWTSALSAMPFHASCKINWAFNEQCSQVKNSIVNQIKAWKGPDNCKKGGEKCLYYLKSETETQVTAMHETPKKHYKDDLTFTFKQDTHKCKVLGYSRSQIWYAVLDYGTNYCNLHNLITGAGLDKTPGYVEKTSNSVCTQFSSADCEKY